MLAEYSIEQSIGNACYAIHGDKFVVVGFDNEQFYFYVNGKKVASRSPGSQWFCAFNSLRVTCCDKYFAVTYWDNKVNDLFHLISLLFDYDGNIIWSYEQLRDNNTEYGDVCLSDTFGLIVAYYGKLIWVNLDGTSNTYDIPTGKDISFDSGVCWSSTGNVVLYQGDCITIYKLSNLATEIGYIPYTLLKQKFADISEDKPVPGEGIYVFNKLTIDSDDTIYYSCGSVIYHRKLDGTFISSHLAKRSDCCRSYANNGLFHTWCECKHGSVKLFSIATSKMSQWIDYVIEKSKKLQKEKLEKLEKQDDDCVIC